LLRLRASSVSTAMDTPARPAISPTCGGPSLTSGCRLSVTHTDTETGAGGCTQTRAYRSCRLLKASILT
jgi:hypothetical protein